MTNFLYIINGVEKKIPATIALDSMSSHSNGLGDAIIAELKKKLAIEKNPAEQNKLRTRIAMLQNKAGFTPIGVGGFKKALKNSNDPLGDMRVICRVYARLLETQHELRPGSVQIDVNHA